MRSEFCAIDVRRRLQDVERIRREVVRLRPRQHADGRVTIRQRDDRVLRRQRRALRQRRIAERQTIAGEQRAAVDAAHPADQVRRAAAEHRRHRDAAGDGQVGARAAPPRAEPQPRSGRDRERRVRRHLAPVERQLELGAGDRDEPLVLELELRSEQRHLEQRRVAVVADQRVRQPMRHRIHRAGDRHAAATGNPQRPRSCTVVSMPGLITTIARRVRAAGRATAIRRTPPDRSDRTAPRRRPSSGTARRARDRTA